MTPRLPILKARDVIRVLHHIGFQEIRTRGSHVFFQHPDGRTTLVPRHAGEDITRGLFKEILHQINLSAEDFFELL